MTDLSQKYNRLVIEGEHEGYKFEWSLTLKPASSKPAPMITCTECNGCRGMFGAYDQDDRECWKCNGSGKTYDPTFRWNPEPPEELVMALRKVWREYWNKTQNDKFELS